MKNQKSFKIKKPIKEGSMSNFESIAQFKEQVERYILKHKDNPNAVINDLASGLFFAFSEAFSKDGRPETNGLNMLEKMINKLRILMKTHENLIPPEQEEFDFEDSNLDSEEINMEEDENEVQDMVDDLDDTSSMDKEEEEEINGIYESKRGSSMKRYSGLKEGKKVLKESKMTDLDLIVKFDQLKDKKIQQEWYNLFEDIESDTDNDSINYLGDDYYEVTNGEDMVELANEFLKKNKIKLVIVECLGLNDDGEILWKVK